jgi:hypothetical protein
VQTIDRLLLPLIHPAATEITTNRNRSRTPTVQRYHAILREERPSAWRSKRSSFWTLVRPAKAGMFSGRQSHRGKSQEPRSLGCICRGNEADEANRQSHPWDGEQVTGPQRE